jgi:rare lipoprotein A
MRFAPSLILFLTLFITSCTTTEVRRAGIPERPTVTWRPFQSGIASWYGGRHHGGPTASGQRYNQWAMTAAHRKLPFGTLVRVTNVKNGKSCIVRINDRGPFVRGRVIDLSAAAARDIGVKSAGIAPVKLELKK